MTKRVLIVDDEPSVDDDFDGLWWDAASSARRRPALRSAAGTGSKACLRYVYLSRSRARDDDEHAIRGRTRDCGLPTGVRHDKRVRSVSRLSPGANQGDPLKESNWQKSSWPGRLRGRLAKVNAKTSRSWQSIAKAIQSTSPLQHGIRKMSEHQRWFEAGCCTWPRCGHHADDRPGAAA